MKTCYGRDTFDLPLEECDKLADAMYEHMKTLEDWREEGIALFVHKSKKFLFDCNAITATVYKAEEDGSFYTGPDGFHALISDAEGIKEWMNDEGL